MVCLLNEKKEEGCEKYANEDIAKFSRDNTFPQSFCQNVFISLNSKDHAITAVNESYFGALFTTLFTGQFASAQGAHVHPATREIYLTTVVHVGG